MNNGRVFRFSVPEVVVADDGWVDRFSWVFFSVALTSYTSLLQGTAKDLR